MERSAWATILDEAFNEMIRLVDEPTDTAPTKKPAQMASTIVAFLLFYWPGSYADCRM